MTDRISSSEVVCGETLNNRYVLRKLLGSGASAKVWMADDLETNTSVAVKCYSRWNGSDKQFKREISMLQFLNKHDTEHRIYRHIENFMHQGKHVIAMEYYPGSTVKQELQLDGRKGLSIALIRRVMADLLQSLNFLCTEGVDILHGDLKPDNVIICNNSNGVRLIDFGLAYKKSSMMKNMYIQSRWYRSPEVLMGIPATPAIDMWSLGCLLVEMFIGVAPFRGRDSFDQMKRISDMLGLPNDNMRSKCEPATIKKLDELEAEIFQNQKAQKVQISDVKAATKLKKKLLAHRKTRLCEIESDRETLADLASKLLTVDPECRISAAEALSHPFVNPITKVKKTKCPDLVINTSSESFFSLSPSSSPARPSSTVSSASTRLASSGSIASSPGRSWDSLSSSRLSSPSNCDANIASFSGALDAKLLFQKYPRSE